jgi:site-specific DNA recombinase
MVGLPITKSLFGDKIDRLNLSPFYLLSHCLFGDISVYLGMEKRDKTKDLKMGKKVIGYIRTSTKLQSNSIEMQTNKIKDYCELNNLPLGDIIIDEGLSGKDMKNRMGLFSIIQMIDKKEINTLIVLSLSRMGRNLNQNFQLIEKMKKKNVNLISLKENVDLTTPMGKFFVNVMNSLYEMERETISDRVSDVLIDKKRNGKVYGEIPFGFSRNGDDLIPNLKEQKILKKIKTLKEKGLSFAKVSDFLNRNDYLKRNGKKFNRSDVYYMTKINRNNIAVSA